MVQTDLKSDNFCGFNQAASSMYWILDPVQNHTQFTVGETGVYAGVGLHTPSEVIDVSSSIVAGGRDNLLTMCNPPIPSMVSEKGYETDSSIRNMGPHLPTQGLSSPGTDMQSVQGAKFTSFKGNLENIEKLENTESNKIHNQLSKEKDMQEKQTKNYSGLVKADGSVVKTITDRTGFLQPQTTTFRRSAMDYSSVDWQAGFSGNSNNLYTNPQNLTNVIERMWLERGGLDQNQLIKQSQEEFVPNNKNGPLGLGEPTRDKIRQPYNTRDPFGLPTGPNGETIPTKHSRPFNALDVTSVGISSPLLEQDNRIPFNYNAMYSNGGCNKISFLKDNIMCNNDNNDLTGVQKFNYRTDIPPAGLYN